MGKYVSLWSVYILECGDGTLYTGISNDLPKRILIHNAAKGAKYTKVRLPVKLVYKEGVESHSAALKREFQLKKLTRLQKKLLIKNETA